MTSEGTAPPTPRRGRSYEKSRARDDGWKIRSSRGRRGSQVTRSIRSRVSSRPRSGRVSGGSRRDITTSFTGGDDAVCCGEDKVLHLNFSPGPSLLIFLAGLWVNTKGKFAFCEGFSSSIPIQEFL
ncbi:hypothetical protein HPP92_008947 [Vanilla planifolia]|uniref:Uncharacterized protein n=1 Tax=Vanilla planifolia TaxID=51239 RepID=A0A835RIY4_VANPL|nr:hypothetical protein HPP92_008947 [Vanilla planifolia]